MKRLCGVLVAFSFLAPAGAAEEPAQRYRAADGVKFLRAECLYHGKQYAEAKQILTTYWAFMNGSPAAKKRYEELDAQVGRALAANSSGQKMP